MLSALIPAAASVIGGIMGNSAKNKDIKMQKEFAQSGIQWKVEDAKKAGIHPLAALGAQTTSYAPVSVGGPSIASGLANAGQDIARGIDATRSASARVDAYTKTIQDLNVRRMGLENELLGSQIAKLNATGPKPPFPDGTDRFLIEGQANSPLVKDPALKRTIAGPGQPSTEPGAVVDMGFARTAGGGWAPIFSKDFQERSEEDTIGELAWNMRNRLAPTLNSKYYNPPNIPISPDQYWYYHPTQQEYPSGKSTVDLLGKAAMDIGVLDNALSQTSFIWPSRP